MPLLELTNDQVVELVNQLPPDQQRRVLMTLAQRAERGREQRIGRAEAELTRLAAERGRQWEAMSEDEREEFVNDLVHEDRACRN